MEKNEKIIKYIEILAIILTSGSCIYNTIYWIWGAAGLGLLVLKKVSKRNLKILGILVLFITFNIFLNYTYRTDWLGVVVLILRLLSLAIIYSSLTVKEYSNIFINIILFIAITCLIFFLIITIFGQTVLPLTFYNSQFKTYVTPYFVVGAIGVKRNYGIFWEPGIYQIYLNLALCMILFNDMNKIKKANFKILILVASVISTFSSTGYLVLGIILMIYILNSKEIRRGKVDLIKKIIIATLLIIILLFEVFTVTVRGKFTTSNSSYRSRFDDLLIAVTATIENKTFIGNGVESDLTDLYAKYTSLAGRYTYGNDNIANSNGLGTFTLRCGVAATIIFLLINYRRFKELLHLRGWPLFGVFCAWILCLASEPLHFTPLILSCFFRFYIGKMEKE